MERQRLHDCLLHGDGQHCFWSMFAATELAVSYIDLLISSKITRRRAAKWVKRSNFDWMNEYEWMKPKSVDPPVQVNKPDEALAGCSAKICIYISFPRFCCWIPIQFASPFVCSTLSVEREKRWNRGEVFLLPAIITEMAWNYFYTSLDEGMNCERRARVHAYYRSRILSKMTSYLNGFLV